MKVKARTKAAKINAKRGRRRIEGVAREPNGRISRSKEPASKLALEARARMLQISIEEAKDQKAGTFLGRLHMAYLKWEKHEKCKINGKKQPEQSLSTAQYYALLSAKEAHNDYLIAIGAPGAEYEPHLGSGGEEESAEKWAVTAKKRWQSMQRAIYRAQEEERTRNLWAALDLCVFQEQYLPHMIADLRVLGNALSRAL